ncbi:hypothetical protein [Kitasatospora atroaurantiaca]|uniref:hypothetical protein n=1 Tax=Kitasatospora atroaurantiaca TaxID=285545 RepID=UPI0011A23A7D|nr:hypothetical protein [Kitasatospora atroaurantiaca]
MAAELDWWGALVEEDPGIGELARECNAMAQRVTDRHGHRPEALAASQLLARCASFLDSAGRLRGALPAVQLQHLRATCAGLVVARLLLTDANPETLSNRLAAAPAGP